MSNLKVFENPEFGSIRTVMIDDEPWFVGKDVAKILGYTNPSKALTDHVDEDDKLNNDSLSSLGQRGGWLINESGLYSLILSSKLPKAKGFKRWVTSEVLPSIHETGTNLVAKPTYNAQTTGLIAINYDNERPTVLGRDLHEFLGVSTPYAKWFGRMCEYGFSENIDFVTVDKNVLRADGNAMPQIQHDHQLTISMAKELCMIQRTERGKQARQYFIRVEEAWNSPDTIMQRALIIANDRLVKLQHKNTLLMEQAEENKPKVLFADSVTASEECILVGDLAKFLKQNGVNIGQNRLFAWLRDNNYLMKTKGSHNMPTQYAMERELFKIEERIVTHPNGSQIISKTPKVTGKGQQYFVNLFLKRKNKDSNLTHLPLRAVAD